MNSVVVSKDVIDSVVLDFVSGENNVVEKSVGVSVPFVRVDVRIVVLVVVVGIINVVVVIDDKGAVAVAGVDIVGKIDGRVDLEFVVVISIGNAAIVDVGVAVCAEFLFTGVDVIDFIVGDVFDVGVVDGFFVKPVCFVFEVVLAVIIDIIDAVDWSVFCVVILA